MNGQFEDCTKEVLPGVVETESSSDEEDQNIRDRSFITFQGEGGLEGGGVQFWKGLEGFFDMVAQEPKDNRRCRKIFDDFKTGRVNDFQRISIQSRALLKGSEDVVRTSQTFLSNYTRYCLLGVRSWSECVRSAGVRLTHNA